MALKSLVIIIALFLPSIAAAQSNDNASYLTVIRQELARLSLKATCQTSNESCVFVYSLDNDNKKLTVSVRFSSATNTVYVCIERFLTLKDPNGPGQELSRRLLDLNRQMVTAKFEWDKTTNTIRLSAGLNTDSNFDRKAFRSQVLGLLSNASTLWPELKEHSSADS